MAFTNFLLLTRVVHEVGRFGVLTPFDVPIAIPPLVQGDVVGMVCAGTMVYAYVNGVLVGSTDMGSFTPVAGVPGGRFGCGREDPASRPLDYAVPP